MRYNYQKSALASIIKRDMPYLIIAIVFLVVGIALGSLSVKLLDYERKKELVTYMNRFFLLVTSDEVSNSNVLSGALRDNLQTVGLVWLLSLTVIGIPFTLFVVALKGYVAGFTVAFLTEGFGFHGLLFSVAAILPHNLIVFVCILVLAVESLKYSMGLLRRNFMRKTMSGPGNGFSMHMMTAVGVFVGLASAALVEAFVSTTLTRLLSGLIAMK